MSPSVPWSVGETIPVAQAGSREPALALIGETLHLVWNHNRILYHAWRGAGVWREPVKVAFGEQPVLAAAAGGQLQCLYVNQFLRNYEIYHVTWNGAAWSLPVNASLTYGASSRPALALAADGTLHAAWADTTPGYSTIYYGTRGATFWANRPIPSGRGIAPAIAAAADGSIYVAWADRRADTGVYDIFCSIYRDTVWYPPESISDSADAHSLAPQLVMDSRGACHVAWEEERAGSCHIFHADRRPNGWARPSDVSQVAADCRLARLTANPAGFVHIVWSDGYALTHRVKPVTFDTPWRDVEPAVPGCCEATGLSPTFTAARRRLLAWDGLDATGIRHLYHAEREPFPRFSIFMPIVAR
jgi:hypothetical protein